MCPGILINADYKPLRVFMELTLKRINFVPNVFVSPQWKPNLLSKYEHFHLFMHNTLFLLIRVFHKRTKWQYWHYCRLCIIYLQYLSLFETYDVSNCKIRCQWVSDYYIYGCRLQLSSSFLILQLKWGWQY